MQTSPGKLIFGALLGLAAIFLAYRAAEDARFAYLGASDAQAASLARPTDALALGLALDLREQREVRTAPTAVEMRNIEAALVRQPLSRVLLRQVGAKAEFDGDTKRADVAFGIANAMSRRDALTQLWWIERSVQKDDLKSAVEHYHAAMSTHPELYKALLPVLANALAYPEVRAAVLPYIVRQSAWVPYLLDPRWSQIDPANAAKLIDSAPEALRGDRYEDAVARLLSGLAERGQFSEAGRLAGRVIPSFDPTLIASFPVSDRTHDERLGALSWILADSGRLLATANERGGFEVDVEPLDQGPVASRIIPVVGGHNYTFRQSVRGGETASARFTWEARCLPAGNVIWSQRFAATAQVRHDEFVVPVPEGCKGLGFALSARGPEGQEVANSTFEGLDFTLRLN